MTYFIATFAKKKDEFPKKKNNLRNAIKKGLLVAGGVGATAYGLSTLDKTAGSLIKNKGSFKKAYKELISGGELKRMYKDPVLRDAAGVVGVGTGVGYGAGTYFKGRREQKQR